MKKSTYTYILIVMLGLTSCSKFLDTAPTDFLSPKNYFKTEEEINVALTGVYDVLGKSSTYGRTLFFEMDIADDSFVALSSWTQDLALYNYNPSDNKLTDTWTALYNGVNRANMLLENLDNSDLDQEKKDAVRGQALFLRAYYYFILVNNWGNIPLRLNATSSSKEVDFPASSYSEIYHQVVSDMEIAAELVRPISEYNYGSRVTQSVVWGILARVNLKMAGAPMNDLSRYAEVKKWAEKVITAGHSLNPDYRQVFINMCQKIYDTNEVIWEVEFGKKNSTQEEEGSVGSINGIGANASIGYSYGAKHTTQRYFDAFDANDLRRSWSISPYYYAATTNIKTAYNLTQIYNRYDAKWRREYETELPKFNGTTTINFPLLRYSDVLLMLAEAENEINGQPTSVAIDAVNEVRQRAFGKGINEIVEDVVITEEGTGYTSAPSVNFTGGGGSGAKGVALISAGKVTGVFVYDYGKGYSSAPSITFSGGGGTGAKGEAVLSTISTIDANLDQASISSQESFRNAIRKERSLELGYEGLRRFDLIRYGIYITEMQAVANEMATQGGVSWSFGARSGQNISEKDTLFAIPAKEIYLNKALIQNSGW